MICLKEEHLHIRNHLILIQYSFVVESQVQHIPFRYVASIMETFILYRQFAKLPEVRSPKQDTVDFWMELLLQTYKPTVSTDRCPVRQH